MVFVVVSRLPGQTRFSKYSLYKRDKKGERERAREEIVHCRCSTVRAEESDSVTAAKISGQNEIHEVAANRSKPTTSTRTQILQKPLAFLFSLSSLVLFVPISVVLIFLTFYLFHLTKNSFLSPKYIN